MDLTRRDALAALTAGGIAVGGGAALTWDDLDPDAGADGSGSDRTGNETGTNGTADGGTNGSTDGSTVAYTDHEAVTLVAVAEVLFPSSVDGVEEFVETYTVARAREQPAHARATKRALATLDDRARTWYDDRFVALSPGTRDRLLGELSLDTAAPDPSGEPRERLRYYLVNDLLYALYASPTGGRLVGIENPQGYPGGTESYQRGSVE